MNVVTCSRKVVLIVSLQPLASIRVLCSVFVPVYLVLYCKA